MHVMVIEIEQRGVKLDAELRGVDALAERYYRNQHVRGPLHPLEAMRLMHDGAILGGAPIVMADDELAFDQIYATAPVRERSTMDCWYKGAGSAADKAKRLHISRATLYLHWKTALSYFRGRLHAKGLTI